MKKLFSSAISFTIALTMLSAGDCTALFTNAASTEICEYNEDDYALHYGESEEANLTLPEMPLIRSNSGELSYNYRDFTDENNSAVYDALSVWVEPSEDEITVELPNTITLTLSGLPGSSTYTEEDETAFQEAVFSNAKPGIDSLLFDMPEIFWLDTSQLGIGISEATYSYNRINQKYTLKITAMKFAPAISPAFDDLDDAKNYKERLSVAIDNFTVEGDTRYEQIKSIHDTISLFTYYDTEAAFASSAIGSLLEPGVVCEGYSKGFKLICDKIGIPCVLIFGNYDRESNTAHMWNYVMMEDENWYAVDLTWDDTDGDYGQEIKYEYFLKGSDSFQTHHTPDPDYIYTYFTYPELAANDYAISTAGTTTPETTTTTSTTTPETTTTTSTTTPETTTTTSTTTPETTTTTSTTTPETTTTTSTTTSGITTTTSTTTPETTTTTSTTTPGTTTTTSTTTPETTTTTSTTAPETTTTTSTTIIPVYLKGDFNLDGEVTVADLVLCIQSVLGINTEFNCDYNDDGCADVFDVILMRRVILDLYSEN